jgi:solute carrier family 8 (sodium/calcium exchanger)
MYAFVGVAIASDRFMAAIEVITSQEREVIIKDEHGKEHTVLLKIWNQTVADLTLMALGSSAPEIMLAAIEICQEGFVSEDLGPGTIVGSAAFNLFMITAICCVVIPEGQVKKIKSLHVFYVTCAWSIFAYLWMFIIVDVITPTIVEVWEGVLTLIFFPLCVYTSYVTDRRLILRSWCDSCVEEDEDDAKGMYVNPRGMVVASEGARVDPVISRRQSKWLDEEQQALEEFQKHRQEYIDIIRDLRRSHPEMDKETLEEMAQMTVIQNSPKSLAFYRVTSSRKMISGNASIKQQVGG